MPGSEKQKTIFITIFQGVEAKNILRTSILPALLADRGLRIVLFTKSKERAELYRKEFNDPRIAYEVVNAPRPSGMDGLLSRFKFALIKTATTDLKRRIALERGGGLVRYYSGFLTNRLLARPTPRKLIRFFDYNFVKTDIYKTHFEKYKPSLVFMAHLFDEPETHLLREAKSRGVKTVGLINSWDKLTARCALRLLPDKAIVFNDINKEEIIGHHDMPRDKVFVSGLPQYDHYISAPYSSRADFFGRMGVPARKKLIVYAPAGQDCSDSDWKMIDMLYKMKDDGKFGARAEILVRFQPNDPIGELEFKKRPRLLYDYPGLRFSSKKGVDWDMNFEDLKHLADTLHHMSLLICYGSSITVDAAFIGRPVIHVGFEIDENAPMYRKPTTFYKMEHSQKAFSGGGVRRVGNPEELIFLARRYMEEPDLDREARQKMAQSQCKFFDGKSGERIGKFILNELN